MDGNFDDDTSTILFIDFESSEEPLRYAADAENILQRLNDNPNLGPEPFELTQENPIPGSSLMYIKWENNRFKIVLYGDDYYDPENIAYTLLINGSGGYGNEATAAQLAEFQGNARQIVAAFQNPLQALQGARRRRRKTKKTKKVNKKRRTTKRR